MDNIVLRSLFVDFLKEKVNFVDQCYRLYNYLGPLATRIPSILMKVLGTNFRTVCVFSLLL